MASIRVWGEPCLMPKKQSFNRLTSTFLGKAGPEGFAQELRLAHKFSLSPPKNIKNTGE